MGRVPRRKRLKHVKRHKGTLNVRGDDTEVSSKALDASKEETQCTTALIPMSHATEEVVEDSATFIRGMSENSDCLSSNSKIIDSALLCHDYATVLASTGKQGEEGRDPAVSALSSLNETAAHDKIFKAADGTQLSASLPAVTLDIYDSHGGLQCHDYALPSSLLSEEKQDIPCETTNSGASNLDVGQEVEVLATIQEEVTVPLNILVEIKQKLELFMPKGWVPIIHHNSVQVVLLSPHSVVCVQRCIVFLPCGDVKLSVHSKPVCSDPYLDNVDPYIPLQSDTVNYFVDRCVSIVKNVRSMEICGGFDAEKYRSVWSSCPYGEIDRNSFQECRYVETFRSLSCHWLVKARNWRCEECSKLYGPLKRRVISATIQKQSVNTANKYLTEDQKLRKLQDQRRELDCANKKIARLQARMQQLLNKEGVQIDETLSNDLSDILKEGDITPAQSIFLQQQIKASQQKNMVGMRWHPTMIRLALSLHITSPAAYEMLRDTGMVKLPSSRTLFDYLHVKPVDDGIDKVVLDSLALRVDNLKKRHKKFHVLMADEIHISQNLVYQKISGKLVGYTNLQAIDEEVKLLDSYLDDPSKDCEPTLASKVLTYMVKGVSNGIKEVIASFAVGTLSPNQMYTWTWEVVGALERSGLQIVAFVCDGCSVNRAFIKKHKPVTRLPSGLVYDTINKAAPGRVLYFISDVPHLLKTVRNCLLNSRWDRKKGRRRMTRGGKKISWDFIIRLYNLKKGKSLRAAYKLSPMNVYPDSYARMKVKYAAQILSATVAEALEREKSLNSDAAETIFFIRQFNKWFDCLNGAHSEMGRKKRNPNLDPYNSEDDTRFTFLLSFLRYLEDWKEEAQNANYTLNTTAGTVNAMNLNEDDSAMNVEEEDDRVEEETPASSRVLSAQTLHGIEMTTRAFIDLVKYLVKEGTSFLNARVFCQDPLEQHFSKIRASQGGSTNPNLGQLRNRNRAIHAIGQLGIKRRRGNTESDATSIVVTSERLPKRLCKRGPKFHSK